MYLLYFTDTVSLISSLKLAAEIASSSQKSPLKAKQKRLELSFSEKPSNFSENFCKFDPRKKFFDFFPFHYYFSVLGALRVATTDTHNSSYYKDFLHFYLTYIFVDITICFCVLLRFAST